MSEHGLNISAAPARGGAFPGRDPIAGMRVAVTGVTGFIGRALVRHLHERGATLTLLARAAPEGRPPDGARVVALGDFTGLAGPDGAPAPALVAALAGHDAVIHLAGRAHRAVGSGEAALALYRAHNAAPAAAVARAAASAGVPHMLFASTSYVHGHVTAPGRPFHGDSPLDPAGAYALSKAEAEMTLRRLAGGTGLAVTIFRPAAVYGPAPPANIRALARAVGRGLPLPLASVRNRRSFLGLDNLCDFIGHALARPPAAGGVAAWTLADAERPSTPEFVRLLGAALERPARLAPFPPALLRLGLVLAGRRGMAESLLDSFEIDVGAVSAATGWRPPFTLAEGLRRMAQTPDRKSGAAGGAGA
ncbi:NAD-dependent epimerase/dehydratase family protein [Camelimonas abortus]|uniref:NAD-dependent epimerase/dehydratase family protein n=1 Tax=Camelimonas abortus TaxID=1017184 RepID=UPI0035EE57D6